MIATTWGATAAERAANRPCDDLMPGAVQLDRAISIDAPPTIVFAWLCQLRVAPYSYDPLVNTYSVQPQGDGTRLHVRVLFDGPWLLGQTLALINLVMMRKQLRVLKSLAERDALSPV